MDVDTSVDETELKSLESELTSIPDKTVDVATSIDDLNLQNLQSELNSIPDKNINVDITDSGMNEVSTDVNNLSTDLEDAGTSAEKLGTDIDNIDPTSIKQTDEAVTELDADLGGVSGGMNDTTASTDNAKGSMSSFTGVLAGLGIGAFISQAVSGAGRFEDSWTRMGTALGDFGLSGDGVKEKWGSTISSITSSTGRGAGDVREFFTQMGIAGITNADILTAGFGTISGAAFITGKDIGAIENTYQRVVAAGTFNSRTIKQLGLNDQDVYKATGKSVAQVAEEMKTMDSNQRAAYLNGIMFSKYGSDANEAYKNSWQHVNDQLTRSGEFLLRVIGGLILPLVVPALNVVSGVLGTIAGTIDKMNGPLGNAAKLVLGGVVAFGALVAIIVGLSSVYRVLQIEQALMMTRQLLSTAYTYAQTAAQAAYALATEGVSGALAVLRGVTTLEIGTAAAHATAINGTTIAQNEGRLATIGASLARAENTVQTGLSTAATTLLTAATSAYNFATGGSVLSTVGAGASRLALAVASGAATIATGALSIATGILNVIMDANPIMLIVLALAALVAGLIWAYNNVKPVHDAVNWLWGLLTSFWSWMTGSAGSGDIWNWLWKGVKFAWDMVTLPLTIGRILIETFINWLTGGAGASGIWDWIWKGLQGAWDNIYNFFQELANFLIGLPANMNKWGHDIILGLINGIINAIPGLRQALSAIGLNFPQSPPKEGPLAAVTEDGAESWTSGIAGAMSKGLSKFSLSNISKLPSLSNIPSTSAAVNNANSPQMTLHVDEGAVVIKGNADKDVIKNAGTILGESISDSILEGYVSKGGKPMVMMRK
ncbi:hypothetical protein [Methanobacterium spitsbergense]|uniref:Uncharacterized protein n=1 Tax=Methanobacterium spitsbergense TaxID=2874285 RepID=A0A8T5V5T8_9EURY|nr:hypothetical protein [Methanobacterium spitsbergense]MBZ2167015.1 hypothetical protein [Methanobacterium spitsbergense]